MSQPTTNVPSGSARHTIDVVIRLLLLGGLLTWCVLILAPFTSILLWGMILAVALFPFFTTLTRWVGGRRGLAATLLVLAGLALIAVPGYFTARSVVGSVSVVQEHMSAETLRVPQLPPDWYQDKGLRRAIADRWPRENGEIAAFLADHAAEVRVAAGFLLAALGGVSISVLMFIASIILAGFLLGNAKRGGEAAGRFLARALGRGGEAMLVLAAGTIRNVAKGILGVALIQTAMLALGLFIAGVPAAGLLSLVGLMFAIVQVGVGPVAIGVIIYAFASMDTLPAALLSGWLIITLVSDNILKPLLLGRGAAVPTLVIFLGAIGGFLLSGIIGLFTGAVMLSIGYRVTIAWMDEAETPGSAKAVETERSE